MGSLELSPDLLVAYQLIKTNRLNDFLILSNTLRALIEVHKKDIRHIEESSDSYKIFFNNKMLLTLNAVKINQCKISVIDTTSLPNPLILIKAYLQEYLMISQYELEMLIETILENYLILNYGRTATEDEEYGEIFIEFEDQTIFIDPTSLEIHSLCRTY